MKKRLFLLISMIMLSIATYAWKFTIVQIVKNGKPDGVYRTSMDVSLYTSPNRVVINNTWTYYIKKLYRVDLDTFSFDCVNNQGRPYLVVVTYVGNTPNTVTIFYDKNNFQMYYNNSSVFR